MKRREVLKNTSLMMGAALSAGTISAVMTGCKAEQALDWTPELLSVDHARLLAEVVERIIPKTDTPGAKDALVDRFIDKAVKLNFTTEKQDLFQSGLSMFNSLSKEKFSKSFVDLDDVSKDAVLQSMADDAKQNNDKPHIFKTVKELTVAGYFTSELGAKEALVYDPIPGEYKGCVDTKDIGGVWAI